MKIKAAVTWGKNKEFSIEEIELAMPKRTEVLVKMAGVGVCHTDAVARDQGVPLPLPAVLGHEGAGVVVEVGEDVNDIHVGDHVVLSFYSCGHCTRCRSGEPNMCDSYIDVNFSGSYADGTKRHSKGGQELSCFFGQSSFAEYAVADRENCVVIDKDVDISIMGPLGCGIQTGAGTVANNLKPDAGDTIAVFGCGAVGLSAVMMAKYMGCSKIIAVDIVESRLALAAELGATHTINGREKDTVGEIMAITGAGTDYAIDTTAVPELILQALNGVRKKGVCAVVGSSGDKVITFNIMEALMGDGKTLKGVIEGDSIPKVFIPKLVDMYKNGDFPFDRLITGYPFEKINEAFEDSRAGRSIKPVLKF